MSKIWNDDILSALESKSSYCRQMKRPHFQWTSAVQVIRGHNGNIKKASQLAKYVGSKKNGFGQRVFEYITDVMEGRRPIVHPPPTTNQLAKVSQTGQSHEPADYEGYMPQRRSGAYAILLTLMRQGPTLTKDQIIRSGQQLCDTEMNSNSVNRYGAWKGIDTLVKHGLVDRDSRSRDFRGNGGWGKAKDVFTITSAGEDCARKLEADGQSHGRTPQRTPSSPSRQFGSSSRWGQLEPEGQSEEEDKEDVATPLSFAGAGCKLGSNKRKSMSMIDARLAKFQGEEKEKSSKKARRLSLPAKPSVENEVEVVDLLESSREEEEDEEEVIDLMSQDDGGNNSDIIDLCYSQEENAPNIDHSDEDSIVDLTTTNTAQSTTSTTTKSTTAPKSGRRICVVVDKNERLKNKDPNNIFAETNKMLNNVETFNESLCLSASRHNLALGDYQWVADHRKGADYQEDEMNDAVVLDYVVERKAIGDLVSRSRQGDHLKQIRRLKACGLSHALILLENDQATASGHTAYRKFGKDLDNADEVEIADIVGVHNFIIDLILDSADDRIGFLETTDPPSTWRLLVAMTALVALEDRESGGSLGRGTLKKFGTKCRGDSKKLKAEELVVKFPRVGRGIYDLLPPTEFPLKDGKVTGVGILHEINNVTVLKADSAKLIDTLVSNYAGPVPAQEGQEDVVRCARAAAEKFASTLPRSRRLVLLVENVQGEIRRRKGAAHRKSTKGERINVVEKLANGGGLLFLLDAVLLALVLRHDVFVKHTSDAHQTNTFGKVLEWKCQKR